MIFVDHIVVTQRAGFRDSRPDFVGPRNTPIPVLAGIRRISYREAGDIDKDGEVVTDTEVISESQSAAWLHGSHETRIQVKSDGFTLLLAGNPGRFGRPENVWNYDLEGTVRRANEIAYQAGFPAAIFRAGELLDYSANNSVESKLTMKRADEATETRYDGSRVWSIHLTQNYVTGSPSNLKAVMAWLGTQSMRRVTRKQRGDSTLEFGAIGYCQTQLYDKAAELLAHCKNKDERAFLQETLADEEKWFKSQEMSEATIKGWFRKRLAWKEAHEKGLLRVEVKCAKDYLVHKGLTYLGAWNMGKVIEIFKERTEVLERLEVEVDEMDIMRLPKSVRKEAAMWLAGIDLATPGLMSRATRFRKKKILAEYGLDVDQKRDMAVVRPIMKQIEIRPCSAPEWYEMQAA